MTLTLKASIFKDAEGKLKISTGMAGYNSLFGSLGGSLYDSFRITGIICKSNADGVVGVPGQGTYLLDADAVKPVKIKVNGELITRQTLNQQTNWYDESAQVISETYNPKMFVSVGGANVADVLVTFYPSLAQ